MTNTEKNDNRGSNMNKLKLKTPIEWHEYHSEFPVDQTWFAYACGSNSDKRDWLISIVATSKRIISREAIPVYAVYRDGELMAELDRGEFSNIYQVQDKAESIFLNWLNSIAEPSDMIPVEEVRKMITMLEDQPENQYKVVGVRESYSQYREGREDMLAEVSERFDSIVSKYIKERE